MEEDIKICSSESVKSEGEVKDHRERELVYLPKMVVQLAYLVQLSQSQLLSSGDTRSNVIHHMAKDGTPTGIPGPTVPISVVVQWRHQI